MQQSVEKEDNLNLSSNFIICGNADTYFYCMKIILDSINTEKCIYFEKKNSCLFKVNFLSQNGEQKPLSYAGIVSPYNQ